MPVKVIKATVVKTKALKPIQLKAVHYAAIGIPDNEIAKKLGVTAPTMWRWQQLQPFKDALRAAMETDSIEVSEELNKLKLQAIATLRDALNNPKFGIAVKGKIALGIMHVINRS